jgi:hypothetical protein
LAGRDILGSAARIRGQDGSLTHPSRRRITLSPGIHQRPGRLRTQLRLAWVCSQPGSSVRVPRRSPRCIGLAVASHLSCLDRALQRAGLTGPPALRRREFRFCVASVPVGERLSRRPRGRPHSCSTPRAALRSRPSIVLLRRRSGSCRAPPPRFYLRPFGRLVLARTWVAPLGNFAANRPRVDADAVNASCRNDHPPPVDRTDRAVPGCHRAIPAGGATAASRFRPSLLSPPAFPVRCGPSSASLNGCTNQRT